MEVPFAIILIAAVTACLTSILCRLLQARHRRVSWFLALACAAVVGMLTVLAIYQEDVFHPERWRHGKAPLDILMLLTFGFSTVVCLVPALLVVGHYRTRMRNAR